MIGKCVYNSLFAPQTLKHQHPSCCCNTPLHFQVVLEDTGACLPAPTPPERSEDTNSARNCKGGDSFHLQMTRLFEGFCSLLALLLSDFSLGGITAAIQHCTPTVSSACPSFLFAGIQNKFRAAVPPASVCSGGAEQRCR